jgi:hypothetical protein
MKVSMRMRKNIRRVSTSLSLTTKIFTKPFDEILIQHKEKAPHFLSTISTTNNGEKFYNKRNEE